MAGVCVCLQKKNVIAEKCCVKFSTVSTPVLRKNSNNLPVIDSKKQQLRKKPKEATE